MQIDRRISALENANIETMSDEKLERLRRNSPPALRRWVSRLTDDELEILAHAKPGCSALLATAPREYFQCR